MNSVDQSFYVDAASHTRKPANTKSDDVMLQKKKNNSIENRWQLGNKETIT